MLVTLEVLLSFLGPSCVLLIEEKDSAFSPCACNVWSYRHVALSLYGMCLACSHLARRLYLDASLLVYSGISLHRGRAIDVDGPLYTVTAMHADRKQYGYARLLRRMFVRAPSCVLKSFSASLRLPFLFADIRLRLLLSPLVFFFLSCQELWSGRLHIFFTSSLISFNSAKLSRFSTCSFSSRGVTTCKVSSTSPPSKPKMTTRTRPPPICSALLLPAGLCLPSMKSSTRRRGSRDVWNKPSGLYRDSTGTPSHKRKQTHTPVWQCTYTMHACARAYVYSCSNCIHWRGL